VTSKERFLAVFNGELPDRLPVTTHHVMPYFLNTCLPGNSSDEFFERFGIDPIRWVVAHTPGDPPREYVDPDQGAPGFLEARRVATDQWRIRAEPVQSDAGDLVRYHFVTPEKTLTTLIQTDAQSAWVVEHLIKEKSDVDTIAHYATAPHCDIEAVNREADAYGERGLIRGHICCFDVFGQPGCWQDAACLYGTENLILATYDDPQWVHTLLKTLQERKKAYIRSLQGARYDILELGGGDASTTVISPALFEEFVAPYDSELIALAHEAGQRVVYHTCGGMMPILETIADMQPDAMETFTPPTMGGDVDLREAKRRIGDRVVMIGGFDQGHFFSGCTTEDTRRAVRECFESAGDGGGFILSPSDHFFDADLSLIDAFADEARKCTYP